MSIKVGNAPVSWGVMEVEGWSGQKPYGAVLDEIRQAGYSGTELGPYGFFPVQPEKLAAELKARDLELVAAFVPVALAQPEKHEESFQEAMKVARLLAAVGAPLMNLAGVMSPKRMAVAGRVVEARDGMTTQQWELAASILKRIAHACRLLGLATVFHHHTGTFVETPAEVARLCALIEPELVGLCLDTGHYFFGGGNPVEAVKSYGSRIRHLHLKDVSPQVLEAVRRERFGYLDAVRRGVFCELGAGAVDSPRVIQGLLSAGFSGWAIVEQDVDTSQGSAQPIESAIRSRQYLKSSIGI